MPTKKQPGHGDTLAVIHITRNTGGLFFLYATVHHNAMSYRLTSASGTPNAISNLAMDHAEQGPHFNTGNGAQMVKDVAAWVQRWPFIDRKSVIIESPWA